MACKYPKTGSLTLCLFFSDKTWQYLITPMEMDLCECLKTEYWCRYLKVYNLVKVSSWNSAMNVFSVRHRN